MSNVSRHEQPPAPHCTHCRSSRCGRARILVRTRAVACRRSADIRAVGCRCTCGRVMALRPGAFMAARGCLTLLASLGPHSSLGSRRSACYGHSRCCSPCLARPRRNVSVAARTRCCSLCGSASLRCTIDATPSVEPLNMTANPSIERTGSGKPAPAAHVER
jgi:hypothetical protein